ncbi:addiction module HigA family antidote [Paraburkholderia sp. BL23I1N1]|uniref:HigA family addiction module antitoxin n=1 Tax=Paraburkholderia sp. BL23I1N1 TaxID=1938802 RepID=UPI000E72558B|nr:HigA family addiction module antitoxin [Paraburkholderia sp. BL23I1N1]RKE36405.1 addiction module HigA family antidote [Paraburkholderia sp. BL23I1N1]
MARFHNGMRPIHPGEILREEYLAPLGMTPNALANALHVTPTRINDVVRERRGVTPDTAIRLARYFGGDAESWLNLQQTYDLQVTLQQHGREIETEVLPREAAIA